MACHLAGAKPLSEPMLEYWTLVNKLQWNVDKNLCIFIQENAFENVVWKMAAILPRPQWVNWLAAEKCWYDFRNGIFNLALLINIFRFDHYNSLRWIPLDPTDDKSILVQVMAWCRQATSHYLSQYWTKSMLPYGITGPQWVKEFLVCIMILSTSWKSYLYLIKISLNI